MDILKITVPTNSVTECWHSIPQNSEIQLAMKMLPTQPTERRHTGKSQKVWMLWSHTRASESQTCLKHYFLSSEHFYTYPGTLGVGGGIAIFDKKNSTSIAGHKASKNGEYISQCQSQFLYLQYRRAQLMDEDCLATPGPTTSMFLYWINTNRMGTAKKTFEFLQCFYIKKTFF